MAPACEVAWYNVRCPHDFFEVEVYGPVTAAANWLPGCTKQRVFEFMKGLQITS
jgi:hypothetical protein